MNRNRNIKIDFQINGKHDHFIEPKHGTSVIVGGTKPKRKGALRIIRRCKK